MPRVAVVGLGNIGFRVLWELLDLGFDVFGVDSRVDALDRVRKLGVEGRVGDVLSRESLNRVLSDADMAVTALPGSIGFKAVLNVASMGLDVVDVSFFPEDPVELSEIAERNRVKVVVDSGVAPGLSNMLVAMGVKRVEGRRAEVFVGGISRRPDPPLGLAITWSSEDLMEEYVRRARAIINGSMRSLDPLDSIRRDLEVEGLGRLEYFPTDGLRSLLKTYGWLEGLVEYTLRWPGHVDFMRGLKAAGLLADKGLRVDSCIISPRKFLAKVIERRYRDNEDLVVLIVRVHGRRGGIEYRSIVEPAGGWSAMAIATGGFQTAAALLVARGAIRRDGLIYPEYIGEDEGLARSVLSYLDSRGVRVSERLVSVDEGH